MKRCLAGIILLCSGLLVGCGGDRNNRPASAPAQDAQDADSITIGYSAPELTGAQAMIMESFITHAEAKGWTVLTANANSSALVQSQQIDRFITHEQVDAIVAIPIDSRAICDQVEQAQQAGIPFYAIDRGIIGCRANMTMLSDNYQAGVQAGAAMLHLLRERYGTARGTILELQGDMRQNISVQRSDGFETAFALFDDIDIISRTTNWQPDSFASITRSVLSSQHIDGIFIHSDCIGVPAILPVLDELNQKLPTGDEGHIFIVGIDGCGETLDALREGYVDYASSQPLTDLGLIADWIERELNGEALAAQTVVQGGTLWSPAYIQQSANGWQLTLTTTSVTLDNVNEPLLWGNR